MMGAGKSAIGRGLARRLSLQFTDSDLEIEKHAGCRVKEIFHDEGEADREDRSGEDRPDPADGDE